MTDEQLEDLKQFIVTRVSQIIHSEVPDIIDARISQTEARFDKKLEELRLEMLHDFAGVGEAIEEINKHFDTRVSRIEKHIGLAPVHQP